MDSLTRASWIAPAALICLLLAPLRAQEPAPLGASQAPADSPSGRSDGMRLSIAPFVLESASDRAAIIRWDRAALRNATIRREPVILRDLPLSKTERVDLDITPFSVVGPNTRFVLGRKGAPDRPLDYDVSRIALFHGTVKDRPGSHVFLAIGGYQSTGHVDFDGRRFLLSSKGATGQRLPGDRLSVFPASGSGRSLPPGVPLCGVADHHAERPDRAAEVTTKEAASRNDAAIRAPSASAGSGIDADATAALRLAVAPDPTVTPDVTQATESTSSAIAAAVPRVGLKHLELAVETDFEYFSLFPDATAAADYLVAMYGEVSAIYMRDLNIRVELVYGRIWDQPDDLFNVVDPSPLNDFVNYWNANMGSIHRDAAQLFSGRSDYPFGGQAYLSALCGSYAYGVVGYAMGFFPDPTKPSPYNYDVEVTAHELGHNAGTGHTHDSPNFIDTCDDPTTTAQRGTIMSYCSQTWSGGNSNTDNYFHAVIQANIESYVATASCIADDCNMNGVPDGQDITGGTSLDANFNGVPDECEDCNGNGVLDPADISGGMPDLNGNGVPDVCEPDCNGNGVPDDRDIALGTSLDAYGNDIPDECEADCNGNGISDYTEIQANMPLDIDRNAILDACQDCDGDGTNDLDALGGAHSLWLASGLNASPIREFYGNTGVLSGASSGTGSLLASGQDLIVTPDGRILATSGNTARIAEYALDGTYLRDLVAPGAGGLSLPAGLVLSPAGTLLVSSRGTDSVLEYDATTGTPLGAFVASGAGGLLAPFGLVFGPEGHLFVTSATNEVLEYDGTTGAFIRVFVSASDNGGLNAPRGIAFKPDGNLLVASYGTNETLEYARGTGKSLGKWAKSGTATRLTQVSPWGIRIGPNGNVYIVRTGEDYGSPGQYYHHEGVFNDGLGIPTLGGLHLTNAQIYEFDVRNGNFVRAHINGNDHGMLFPTGFDFVPGWDIDCNLNLLQDSCDIASGFSQDVDANGVPDECQIDCNGNGNYDRTDIIPYGSSFDCNSNLVPDECDLAGGTSADCNANGIPDECEADCNDNGVPDECDITAGVLTDCDGDNLPDQCDPDCNGNGTSDICDIVTGGSLDCNTNRTPDECEPDCNGNSVPDECDIASGTSSDCNGNGFPDDCETTLAPVEYLIGSSDLIGLGNDCGGNSLYACSSPFGFKWTDTLPGSAAEIKIEFNVGVECHATGTTHDTTLNGAVGPSYTTTSRHCTCSVTPGDLITIYPSPADYVPSGENVFKVVSATDCIGLIPATALGGAFARVTVTPYGDCDGNGVPDDCDPDCNFNGVADGCDISGGTSADCNANAIPDECEPDCNTNGVPDECDIAGGSSLDCNTNTVPDECDIAGGTSADDNADGIPDECQIAVPDPPVATGETAKTNRYLRFSAPPSGMTEEIIRVRILSLDGYAIPDPDVLYLGPPVAAPEEDSSSPGLTFVAARLQCAPYVHDWATVGIISAYGGEIIPGSTYDVQRAAAQCPNLITDEACWSDAVTITTAKWGDVAPLFDGDNPDAPQPDFNDIAAIVEKFLATPGAPIKAVAQLQPNVVFPKRAIDFRDIAADVQAFLGTSYAADMSSTGPCPCPSAVTCGATACTADLDCGAGYCVDGFCADACGRCQP